MAYVTLGNPIWSCQFLILGGWRRLGIILTIYVMVLSGSAAFYLAEHPGYTVTLFANEALPVLAVAQAVLLVLCGTGAVGTGLLRDNKTRMIESHRTSPMRSLTVIVGYLLGTTIQFLVLFAGNLVAGMGLTALAGSNPLDWLVGNAYLLIISVSIWSAVLGCVIATTKQSSAAVFIIVMAMSGPGWIPYFPAFGLAGGVYGAMWSYYLMLGSNKLGSALGIILFIAIVMLVFWCCVAVRRFRHPHLPFFSVRSSFVLLILWMGISWVALTGHELLIPVWAGKLGEYVNVLLNLIGMLIMAAIPICIAAQMQALSDRGMRVRSRLESCTPTFAAVLSSGIVLLNLILVRMFFSRQGWGSVSVESMEGGWLVMVAATALCGFTVCGMVRATCYATGRLALGAGVFFLLWTMPVLVDFIRAMIIANGEVDELQFGWLMGCSPLGTIAGVVLDFGLTHWLGIAVQAAIMLFAIWLGRRAEHLFVKKRRHLLARESAEGASAGGC